MLGRSSALNLFIEPKGLMPRQASQSQGLLCADGGTTLVLLGLLCRFFRASSSFVPLNESTKQTKARRPARSTRAPKVPWRAQASARPEGNGRQKGRRFLRKVRK